MKTMKLFTVKVKAIKRLYMFSVTSLKRLLNTFKSQVE